MSVLKVLSQAQFNDIHRSGRVIKELGYRRSDLIITTKVYWGVRHGSPNDTGLSRKQWVTSLSYASPTNTELYKASSKGPKSALKDCKWIMLTSSLRTVLTILVRTDSSTLSLSINSRLSFSAHGGSRPCIQLCH